MRYKTFLTIICATLFLVGNKSCEKTAPLEHPDVEEGVECASCHEDGRTKETKPKGHDLAFERTHGQFAKKYGYKTDSYCYLCHTESQCTSCHQQEPPRDHTQFWRLRGHGMFVGLNRSRCYACHRADSCDHCHAETQPFNHNALWGDPSNRHCLSCHFPLGTAGAERCGLCHTGAPSHAATPPQPANAFHLPGAVCRSCHAPLVQHPDNGMGCEDCHTR